MHIRKVILTVFCLSFLISPNPVWSDSQAPGPGWKRLYSDSAQASSFLRSNWNKYNENYHPNYILDDDPTTAWVKGTPGAGIGETITWAVSPLKTADQVLLRIRNGYQKSKRLFKANSAVKELEVALQGDGRRDVVRKTFTLKDEMGWQDVRIDVPKSAGFSGVALKIISVYPGTVYSDLCISDVQTYVESKMPYNETAEISKHKRLMQWVHARLADAKYFASLPAEYPFASSNFAELSYQDAFQTVADAGRSGGQTFYKELRSNHFDRKFAAIFTSQERAHVIELLAQAEKLWESKDWYRETVTSTAKKSVKPDVSGENASIVNEVLGTILRYSQAADISYFATPNAVARQRKSEGDSDDMELVSNVKLERYPGGNVRAIYFWEKDIVAERGISEYQTNDLVVLDSNQRIKDMLLWSSDGDISSDASIHAQEAELRRVPTKKELFTPTELKYVTVSYDSNGKIDTIRVKFAAVDNEDGMINDYATGQWGAVKSLAGW